MNVVVIGLGSMGQRRMRLINKYDQKIKIFGVDTNYERRIKCEKEYGIKTFNSLTDAIENENIGCSFVCTSPLSHSKITTECLNNNLNVFTELNLVDDGYEDNINLAKQKGLVLFLSSTFLYRDEIKEIKRMTQQSGCLINYTYHVGQYLPDWHPWEKYKDFFINDKRTNGCREIFAIELPWLIDTFGDIVKFDVMKSKMSNLNVDYNDNYLLTIQHDSGYKGTLAVDIVSRKAVRNLEIFGEQIYIHWDGSPTGLYTYDFEAKKDVNLKLYEEIDQLKDYSSFVVENSYSNEITSFFEAIKEKKEPIYSFEKDLKIIKLIDNIES